jgi:hypothetical protein
MTLRQIGQLVLMSALWGAVFMLIKVQQYKRHQSVCSAPLVWAWPLSTFT